MSFTEKQVADLSAKLHPEHVKQRSQAGRNLSYVEGWHAIAEANRIFGFDGWQRETTELRAVSEHERDIGKPPNTRKGWGVTYIARCRVTVHGVVREGAGSGHGIDVDRGLAHESALKEAETDAMKRALMTFGNPFGLALYDKTQANVGEDDPAPAPEELRERFKTLGEKVRQCPSVQAIDELLMANADFVASFGPKWRSHWNELVETKKAALSGNRKAA